MRRCGPWLFCSEQSQKIVDVSQYYCMIGILINQTYFLFGVCQETELDAIIHNHIVNNGAAAQGGESHVSSSSDNESDEHSAHDTVTSVLHINPPRQTQDSESSSQSPAVSPRPILTSQQSIVSGRFTRTSCASGETGYNNSPARLSPIQVNSNESQGCQEPENQENIVCIVIAIRIYNII